MQNRIEDAISDYNRRPGRPAGLPRTNSGQENFLRIAVSKGKEGWRSLATALISYFLEWDYRSTLIELRAGDGTAEPFLIHLFKGCILFESLLKANPKDAPPSTELTLGAVLKYLSPRLGIPNIVIGNTDFPMVLNDLSSANDSIPTALQFAGRVRNTVGHNLGWKVALALLSESENPVYPKPPLQKGRQRSHRTEKLDSCPKTLGLGPLRFPPSSSRHQRSVSIRPEAVHESLSTLSQTSKDHPHRLQTQTPLR
jgi:hypothetical protein